MRILKKPKVPSHIISRCRCSSTGRHGSDELTQLVLSHWAPPILRTTGLFPGQLASRGTANSCSSPAAQTASFQDILDGQSGPSGASSTAGRDNLMAGPHNHRVLGDRVTKIHLPGAHPDSRTHAQQLGGARFLPTSSVSGLEVP